MIDVFKVDTASGKLSVVQHLQPNDQNQGLGQSTLLKQGSNRYFFIVSPLLNGVFAFSIGSDGQLTAVSDSPYLIPQNLLFGPQIGKMVPSSDGMHLYALDISGSVVVMKIGATGAITYESVVGPPSSEIGFGYDALLDPTGTSLYYTTGSIDQFDQSGNVYSAVLGYSVDPATGTPTIMAAPSLILPPNSQPNFITDEPTGQFYFIGLNNSGAIAAFSRAPSTGAFTQAPGSPFTVGGPGAQVTGIAVHSSGKYLYSLNLWDHTIIGYSINASTGALIPLPGSPFPEQTAPNSTVTQGPLAVDASGNLLFVGTSGQYIAVYKINQNTGALSAAGSPQSTQGILETFNFLTMN